MRAHVLPVSLALLLSIAAHGEDAVPVSTAAVMREALAPEIWVPATVVSRADAEVATDVGGLVVAIHEVGERVRAGDPIAELNTERLTIQLRNDVATIDRYRTQIAFLGKQLDRYRELSRSNSAAAADLDRLQMERDVARHDLAAAEARRDQTQYEIEQALVRAPFDGVIVSRLRQPGEYVAPGQALVRLVEESHLEARAQAPIDVVRHLRVRDSVVVDGDAGRVPGVVRAVVPVGDERSRTAEIRVTLDPADWLPGEAVRVSVPRGVAAETLSVPRDALVMRDAAVYVFRIDGAGAAERIAVETGQGDAERVSVTGALQEGDRVVVRGAERLRHGQIVRVLAPTQSLARASRVSANGS